MKIKIFKLLILTIIFIFFPINTYAQNQELEPIVLVPGIMGSWNWEVFLERQGEGNWGFFATDHTWENIITAFEEIGYERDQNLFIAFYDWRQSNINSATDYLIPTIDRALLNSSTGKVDVIAHSMGGLVVRRYIQSDDYRDDVDQLIMLGTPNYGSSDVYTLWEGGFVPDNWGALTEGTMSFYLWYMTTATGQTADNFDTVRTFIPSIGELLPVYDFLEEANGEVKFYDNLLEAKNPFLEHLNSEGNGANMEQLGGITVIAGKGEATVKNIPVVTRSASESKLWADGRPEPLTPVRNDTTGDNRVLTKSAFINEIVFIPQPSMNFWDKLLAFLAPKAQAQFDEEEFLREIEIDSKHGDLPTRAIPDIFTALDLPEPTVVYVPPPEPDNITSFWFASPVEVRITDPQGRVITRDSNEIPGAVYTGESDPNGVKMVLIPEGVAGEYQVELTGTENGDYHFAVASFTEEDDEVVTTERSIAQGERILYSANVDPTSPNLPVELSEPTILEPGETATSTLDLINNLIGDVKDYYEEGKIRDKRVYQSLSNDLKTALKVVREAELVRPIDKRYSKLHQVKVALAKKLVLSKLHSFISTLETHKKKGKKIDAVTAQDLIIKAQAIITQIKST